MKSQRFCCGFDNHSALRWVIVCACAVVLFSPTALCEESQDGPSATERSTAAKPAAKPAANPAVNPAANPAAEQPAAEPVVEQPVPEYARRVADGLIEESSTDMLGLVPGDVEPSFRKEELRGPGRWFFNTRIGQKFARFESGDIRRRPMMYWRRFADRNLPPIGTFLFLLFFNTTICLVFRKRVEVASRCVSKSFWKSLFAGMFFVILMATGARLCFDSALYTPCALLILGIVELLSLAGLAVSSRTVGQALLNKLGYTSNSQAADAGTEGAQPAQKQSKFAYLAPVFIGTILLTLIALLPGLGPLPKLGTRFVMWFSLLGMGALVRTKLGRKELP